MFENYSNNRMLTSCHKFTGRVINIISQHQNEASDICTIVIKSSQTFLYISTNKPLLEMPCKIGDLIHVEGRICFKHVKYGIYNTTFDNVSISVYPKGEK